VLSAARRARGVPVAAPARGVPVAASVVPVAGVHTRVVEDGAKLRDLGVVSAKELRPLLPGVLDVRADGAGAVPHTDDLGVAIRVRSAEVEDTLAGLVLALRVPVVAGDTLHVVDAERVVFVVVGWG